MSENKAIGCKEKYPIGTEVVIIEDCRRLKRATNKKGTIIKYDYCKIPKETFPLKFKKKGVKCEIEIPNLDGDLTLDIPVIRYGRFGKIRGYQCFWSSVEDFEKMIELKNKIEKVQLYKEITRLNQNDTQEN